VTLSDEEPIAAGVRQALTKWKRFYRRPRRRRMRNRSPRAVG